MTAVPGLGKVIGLYQHTVLQTRDEQGGLAGVFKEAGVLIVWPWQG